MLKAAPVEDVSDYFYIGLAPGRRNPDGSVSFQRSDLRFEPNFGASQEDGMYDEYDGDYFDPNMDVDPVRSDPFPGGVPSNMDPDGLSYFPGDANWLDRWAWASDELTVDSSSALNGDVDVYDDAHVPDEYQTLIAGNFGARPIGRGDRRRVPARRSTPQRGLQARSATQESSMQSDNSWQKTVLTTVTTDVTANALAIAGGTTHTQTVTIRPQFDFVAQDVTFEPNIVLGAGGAIDLVWARVQQILFGDRVVYQNAIGVPIQAFAAGVNAGGASFIRGIIKGAKIQGGLDIIFTINWNVTDTTAVGANAVQITAVIIGLKPSANCY